MKVLLIDDDNDLATLFSTALTHAGYEVSHAADGKTGIDYARTQHPSLILIDQILPDTSGNEILKTLKSDEATKAIPMAMLSNFGQNELVEEALKIGALDYILKYQVEPQDVVNKVNGFLKQGESETKSTQVPA